MDYGSERKKNGMSSYGDGILGTWKWIVSCDFHVHEKRPVSGYGGCRRTRRHQPISFEGEHSLTHSAVNVTPNPTPFVDDAVTDLSTSKSTVSDFRL